jgi:hypothetical protein
MDFMIFPGSMFDEASANYRLSNLSICLRRFRTARDNYGTVQNDINSVSGRCCQALRSSRGDGLNQGGRGHARPLQRAGLLNQVVVRHGSILYSPMRAEPDSRSARLRYLDHQASARMRYR